MDFIVGSFNHDLYTLRFEPPTADNAKASFTLIRPTPAIGGHSWLALSRKKDFLYCTAWTKPQPSIAAYSVQNSGRNIQFLNAKPIQALSGYVCCDAHHVYSVGGLTGEVFRIAGDGSIGDMVQKLDFVDPQGVNMSEGRGSVPHGDFGGLRHGAHSADLSPDGRSLYVADIGRNCIWTYSVDLKAIYGEPPLTMVNKHIAPRPTDGPRHTWPHPNGKVLYSLQEHTSMVDLFSIDEDGVTLSHVQGVKVIPSDRDPKHYWADEVRLSTGPDREKPRYMYASTRGLKPETKGYVAVFSLKDDGTLESVEALHIWETQTSGGIANAIEPAPWQEGREESDATEYLALTDSEEGWVFMLSFDGNEVREVARLSLGKTEEGEVVQAATAVWL
ncbi:hypothetical protein LTR48_004395 [Friedmanniomyces endolithicus]|uniref:Muconate cycloisomerase 1 n=1 Tax=Rachicladosporium monterosium TaxID=1507873 RepID=A0ABR0L1B0_9PEZI|nr:hypothetical protein LTR29_009523 [Friedmanniomyces endolithicus]KAK1085595.1 hypothetical protein LTR48_004395 [Friedmanniomyces endolithicus]KAK5141965.1 hypothetical protein LTR32_005597 [Rachicladosporium monterosium]